MYVCAIKDKNLSAMKKVLHLSLSPSVAFDESRLKETVKVELGLTQQDSLYIKLLKRSIDARSRNIKIMLQLEAYCYETPLSDKWQPSYKNVYKASNTCHIIGCGPAGLFAALRCLELGIKPIIIERGKDVQSRRRDLAAIHKQHVVNPDSNYCFGEGGAGTYSDGKLYTRSHKRGSIEKILNTLVYHGAGQEILIDAHPHIGTNKLPKLIQKIRETILQHGGEIYFQTRLENIFLKNNKVCELETSGVNGLQRFPIQTLLLATGHSARDIYHLLQHNKLQIEVKPFAMGLRVEHPQELIDKIQYRCGSLHELAEKRRWLPAASYSLVQQVNGRGVYSFCMCPGGIIAPCATGPEQVVTNGWSPSKRNNPFANSGMVVALGQEDFFSYKTHGPLAGLAFQQEIEKNAWLAGGKTQTAPAQRLLDFVNGKMSSDLPLCSYQPGIRSVQLKEVLGGLISESLRTAFKEFGKKMPNYLTNEAVLVAVESRTSTPVRIPRDADTLSHPQCVNLFPCGEGAGFAGGIVSAAMDGDRCAGKVFEYMNKN